METIIKCNPISHIIVVLFILFQTGCFKSSDGSNGTAVLPELPGFYVNGRFLYTPDGEKVVLIGPNKMVTWTDRTGDCFGEIAKTGANSVRICFVIDDSPADLDRWIQQCINNDMIPVINECSRVGLWPFRNVIDWYCRPDVVEVIKKHEKYLLINIVDEAGTGEQTYAQFEEEYKYAITRMRDAGIHVPLLIDGLNWGQDIEVLKEKGPILIEHDPDHNIMLNLTLYAYWSNPQKIIDEIHACVAMDLPLLCGEWSETWNNCECCVPWDTLLAECNEHEIGHMPWSWGPGNLVCAQMNMTSDNTYKGLNAWGLEVAVSHQHSIKNTAKIPAYILHKNINSGKDRSPLYQ